MSLHTYADMEKEVAQNLQLEGIHAVPSPPRINTRLNRAKNEMVAKLEAFNQNHFTARKAYTVAKGDASISFPDGSTDNRFRRLLSLERTDLSGEPDDVEIIDYRHRQEAARSGWRTRTAGQIVMYIEAMSAYFIEKAGAPFAMTLLLRYANEVPDLNGQTPAAVFTGFPDEYTDLITSRATADLLPANNPGRMKWLGIVVDRLRDIRVAESRRNRMKGVGVRRAVSYT